ncbi:MAG: hypothetical protein ABJC04_04595 [Verrucomicrobiota bacterium]
MPGSTGENNPVIAGESGGLSRLIFMPPEPDKKFDETLKAYAQQRRAGVGEEFTLHPATRKMLQGEVVRTFPSESEKPIARFIFWPRVALIGGFTVMLVVTVMILNTPKKSQSRVELAQSRLSPVPPNETSRGNDVLVDRISKSSALSEDKAFAETPMPASTPAPFQTGNKTEGVNGFVGAEEVDRERHLSEPVANLKKAVAPTVVSRGQAQPADETKNKSARNFAENDPAGLSHSTNSSEAVKTELGYFARNRTTTEWKFVQQNTRAKYRQNLLSPKPPKILQSFQLERSGDEIQLFDSDGSVYTGEILPHVEASSGAREAKQNQVFSFHLGGTNRATGQSVSFAGEVAQTNLVSPAKDRSGAEDGLKQETVRARHVIRGKISLNGTNQFEIHAIESP